MAKASSTMIIVFLSQIAHNLHSEFPMEQERLAHDTKTRRNLAWRKHKEPVAAYVKDKIRSFNAKPSLH